MDIQKIGVARSPEVEFYAWQRIRPFFEQRLRRVLLQHILDLMRPFDDHGFDGMQKVTIDCCRVAIVRVAIAGAAVRGAFGACRYRQ